MRETGLTKHYAIHNGSHKRLILLCLENPEDKKTTIAVPYDELDADTRAELINIADSVEGQSVRELYPLLKKKIFQEHPKVAALTYLLTSGYARKYNIDEITVYYSSTQYIAMSELITQIHASDAKHFGNKATLSPFSDTVETKQEVSNQPQVEDNNVFHTVKEEATVEPSTNEKNQAVNDMLANVLVKMTNKLEEISNKLDKIGTTEAKQEVKTVVKKK